MFRNYEANLVMQIYEYGSQPLLKVLGKEILYQAGDFAEQYKSINLERHSN